MAREPVIRHPGPPVAERVVTAPCDAEPAQVHLDAGADLLEALHAAIAGWDGAAVDLAGLDIGPFSYVMPARSTDGHHAAWYSATHHAPRSRIEAGTAMLGTRKGAPWFHAHAIWDGGTRMGHLLPGQVRVASQATLTLWRWKGAHLDLRTDAETGFPIYHVVQGHAQGSALLVRIAPHEDLVNVLQHIMDAQGWDRAQIQGVGSLIGAGFSDGPDMGSPISEVVVLPAGPQRADTLRVACINPEGAMFSGQLRPDQGAVLVTFELFVIGCDR